MSTKSYTMPERIARLETLIEDKVVAGFEEMKKDIKAIGAKVDEDVADLARLKNRGAGILVGVSIAFTALGALLRPAFDSLKGLFH